LRNYETSFDDLLYFCEKFEIDYDKLRDTLSKGRVVKSLFLGGFEDIENSEEFEDLSSHNRQSSL